MARSGYLNLLLPDKRRSSEPGDSPAMMRSRRAFLQAGFYDPVANALTTAVGAVVGTRTNAQIADLGCGEGFFLSRMKRALDTDSGTRGWYGVDISREGIRMATTYDRSVTWVVASVHQSPFLSRSLDVVVSMCAPLAAAEFRRVLKDDGVLIVVAPGEDHLDALRAIIYTTVVPHAPAMPPSEQSIFTPISSARVHHPIALRSQEQIGHLLAMTPYYWNISLETKARVDALTSLDVTVDLTVRAYTGATRSTARAEST